MPDSPENHSGSDGEDIVHPPIVDLMRWDPEQRAYVVTFIPQETVSSQVKETVEVALDSVEGRSIHSCLEAISSELRLSSTIMRIVHGGGGTFTFHTTDDRYVELAEDSLATPSTTPRVYGLLQRVAENAEHAFLIARLQQLQSHPA